jgi:hypothetical protein
MRSLDLPNIQRDTLRVDGPAVAAPWRDLPERYGLVGTVSSRFYRWCQSGLWQRILSSVTDGLCGLDPLYLAEKDPT